MVENKKRCYVYNHWFEFQAKVGDRYIFHSIPKNEASMIKIEVNQKTNQVMFFYLEKGKMVGKIEISDIYKSEIQIHYVQKEVKEIEIDGHRYDNLLLELFATMRENNHFENCQLMFVRRKKNSNYPWVEPSLPINTKIDIENIDFSSEHVTDFIEFVKFLPIHIKEFKSILTSTNYQQVPQNRLEIREFIIPNGVMFYDCYYRLVNGSENHLSFMNTEDEIRNLEVKVDPVAQLLLGIRLTIEDTSKNKKMIQITPNKQNGVTVKYCNKEKESIQVNHQTMKEAQIRASVIYDNNRNKLEHEVAISSGSNCLNLIGHPFLTNNYCDSNGNLYTIGNSGYHLFCGIAGYAPSIFEGMREKVFVKKLKEEEQI